MAGALGKPESIAFCVIHATETRRARKRSSLRSRGDGSSRVHILLVEGGLTVFFMHIPKTAGTAFRTFLEESVRLRGGTPAPIGGVYPPYEQFLESAEELGEKFDLICGHYPYHVRALLPRGTDVVSIVREPIDRCLSHIKHQIEHERRTGEGCGVSDLNAFIELPVNRFFLASVRNLTVKYLSYGGHPHTAAGDEELSVESALEHCEQSWIGFSDSLDGFQKVVFEHLLRCSGPCPPVQRVNRSHDTTSVDELAPKNRELLRSLNELDLRLYDRLREREFRRLRGTSHR